MVDTHSDTFFGRKMQWLRSNPSRMHLLVLLLLGSVLHLAWLSHPRQVVFDEVHFGSFSTAYCCTHKNFFDIHPPHAKLLIGGTAHLLGYNGGVDFAKIGNEFGEVSPAPLRLMPAIAGILLPLIVLIILRQLGASNTAAFFGGLVVLFDNALLLQTRLIALDGILLAATFGTLALFLAAARTQTIGWRIGLALLTGCAMGLAIGSKITAIAVAGLIAVYMLIQIMDDLRWANIRRWLHLSLWIIAGAFFITILGWALHFSLLTEPGLGDGWGKPSGHLLQDIVELQRKMLDANATLTATHPDSSPWWSWPLMKHPLFYYSTADSERLYFLGNPMVWWGSTVLFLILSCTLLYQSMSAKEFKRDARLLWVPIVGYLAAYLPLVRVTRALFMYHYLMPLLFAIVAGVLWLDRIGWIRPQGLRKQRISFYVAIVMLIGGFIFVSPFTYGFKAGSSMTEKMLTVFSWIPDPVPSSVAQMQPAEMQGPADKSTLAGASVTFKWNLVQGATNYLVWVNKIPQAPTRFLESPWLESAVDTWTATGLPTDGSTLYVTLWTYTPDKRWLAKDYTYTAYTEQAAAKKIHHSR
ncbi:MAG: phospholipid carrier-dependent glycosyltransferase [Gallionellaceae bacterium]|nr:phospholipid carrier-dependent glycosyltransferase [Gallionellaceae bacterium]